MTVLAHKINYDALRLILERELGRPVTIKEAKDTGEWLMSVYGILLS